MRAAPPPNSQSTPDSGEDREQIRQAHMMIVADSTRREPGVCPRFLGGCPSRQRTPRRVALRIMFSRTGGAEPWNCYTIDSHLIDHTMIGVRAAR